MTKGYFGSLRKDMKFVRGYDRVYAERVGDKWEFGCDGRAEWYAEGREILEKVCENVSARIKKVALVYDRQKRVLSFVKVRQYKESRGRWWLLRQSCEELDFDPNGSSEAANNQYFRAQSEKRFGNVRG